MDNCIFCKIANKQIPASVVYEDEQALAFHDTDPKAPVHFLVIPKRHLTSMMEAESELIAHIFMVIKQLTTELGISNSGFRVVTNIGRDAGQSVAHLHFHVLGGRSLHWPPG